MSLAQNPEALVVSMFTSALCRGNPAAVVVTQNELPWVERRRIAIELAQPATAFVTSPPHPTLAWHSRTGRPLPLCGHGTAAAVHLLNERARAADDVTTSFAYSFQEHDGGPRLEGTIVGLREPDGKFGIDLPAGPTGRDLSVEEQGEAIRGWCAASGMDETDVLAAVALPSGYSEEGMGETLVLQIAAAVDLGRVKVNTEALKTLPYRGVWVTSLWPTDPAVAATHDTRGAGPGSADAAAIRSRTFFPKTGLHEDEVCGSAHTFLVPWWVQHEPRKFAQYRGAAGWRLQAVQLSPSGGLLEVLWDGKRRTDGGRCVLFGRGLIDREVRDLAKSGIEERRAPATES